MEIKGITESLFQHLRVRVITGDLKPGQRLTETQLASDFGISRGPLREALRLLENESLVVSFPRKGTYVTQLLSKDFKHVCEVREMIECYAIDLLKEKNVRQFLDEVSSSIIASGSPPAATILPEEKLAHIKANASFHAALIKATGNLWLIKFFQTIGTTLTRCQFMYGFTPGMIERADQEHQQLRDFLSSEAYEKAKKLMRAHINHFLKLLLSQCSKENEEI